MQALSAQSPTGRLQDLPPVDLSYAVISRTAAAGSNRQNPQYRFFRKTPAKGKRGDTGQRWNFPALPSHIEWGKAA